MYNLTTPEEEKNGVGVTNKQSLIIKSTLGMLDVRSKDKLQAAGKRRIFSSACVRQVYLLRLAFDGWPGAVLDVCRS